jgi:pyruvate,orthophosphate dikinase
VRTNADTPHDAAIARVVRRRGIGLCRTEHMFFEPARILAVRELILASDAADRARALDKLRRSSTPTSSASSARWTACP